MINMTRMWDKEKNLSPRQESGPRPPEHQMLTKCMKNKALLRVYGIFRQNINQIPDA